MDVLPVRSSEGRHSTHARGSLSFSSGGKAHPRQMKAYLYTTGMLFAVIAVAHVWEVIDRSHVFASDVLIVALSAGLAVWAWRLGHTRT